jgi:hypothetical protein
VQVELKKGETIMTDASLHLPAAFLHEAFSDRSGVPSDHFELYYRGKRLEGKAALSSWGVDKDAIIEVKMRGRGGMGDRKEEQPQIPAGKTPSPSKAFAEQKWLRSAKEAGGCNDTNIGGSAVVGRDAEGGKEAADPLLNDGSGVSGGGGGGGDAKAGDAATESSVTGKSKFVFAEGPNIVENAEANAAEVANGMNASEVAKEAKAAEAKAAGGYSANSNAADGMPPTQSLQDEVAQLRAEIESLRQAQAKPNAERSVGPSIEAPAALESGGNSSLKQVEEPEGEQDGRGRMAFGSGPLIAGASSFVRTLWQQLRTGKSDGQGLDAGDAAVADGSAATGGEKLEAASAHIQASQAAKNDELRDELAAIGLTKEGVVVRMNEAGIESVEALKDLSQKELLEFMSREAQRSSADNDLSAIKAMTMYKMVEEVHDSKTGSNRKLLFVSSKQADLISRDPSAIDKMLRIFLDTQQPGLVINLLPSMIRCWMLVRPRSGDPDGEREGVAALDRFMAEHIIPLAEKTHAIILCSAVQPFCVLSESLSRMVKLVRARWGSKLPFTIISFSGHVAHLYMNQRNDSTWKAIRDSSKVWRGRENNEIKAKIESLRKDKTDRKDFDMDLDPNGNNFIMVDSTGASTSYGSYNRLVFEVARQLAAELPSIAIKTGKSKVTTTLAETDASGIEVALSNVAAGTPVLLLDLTKRLVMPAVPAAPRTPAPTPCPPVSQGPAGAVELELEPGTKPELKLTTMCKEWWARCFSRLKQDISQRLATTIMPSPAATHPMGEDAGPAMRRRQIEWYREQVEQETRMRVERNLPDYDWDVCMIAHFHDGAPPKLEPAHRTRMHGATCTARIRTSTRCARHSAS